MRKKLITQAIVAASMGASCARDNTLLTLDDKQVKAIDIDKEYELIKQKKSKLSAKKRRWVIAQVESR